VNKKQYFELMEAGDPILFYADGTFFASGRVGTTLRDREFGETIWGSDDSGFIYTVEDYQEHSISTDEIIELLDYGDGWFPRGFMKISDAAVNAILSEYSSVEEAFQTFRSGKDDGTPPWAQTTADEDEGDNQVRIHTEIQWYLIQLGLIHGYDVHVAINDQSQEYDGEELGEGCIDEQCYRASASLSPVLSSSSTWSGWREMQSSRCSRSRARRVSIAGFCG
jgi:hypothetical protein